MNKTFIKLSIIFLLTRLLDGFSTYYTSAELDGELNPVVRILGLGWIGLGIFQILFSCLNIYAIYFYCNKSISRLYPSNYTKKLTYQSFASYIYFGKETDFWKISFKQPKYKIVFQHYISFLLPVAMSLFSVIISLSNFAVNHFESYNLLIVSYGLMFFIPPIILILLISSSLYFYLEYLKYQDMYSSNVMPKT